MTYYRESEFIIEINNFDYFEIKNSDTIEIIEFDYSITEEDGIIIGNIKYFSLEDNFNSDKEYLLNYLTSKNEFIDNLELIVERELSNLNKKMKSKLANDNQQSLTKIFKKQSRQNRKNNKESKLSTLNIKHPILAASKYGASIPSINLLSEYAPSAYWRELDSLCKSVSSTRYKMGSLIYNDKGVISIGYSQLLDDKAPFIPKEMKTFKNKTASLHAEMHALITSANNDLEGATCLIYALNKKHNGAPWSCCSCYSCASGLAERGIKNIIYPQRKIDGSWEIKVQDPKELVTLVQKPELDENMLFAREMRLTEKL